VYLGWCRDFECSDGVCDVNGVRHMGKKRIKPQWFILFLLG
jgi:hypothetical protein